MATRRRSACGLTIGISLSKSCPLRCDFQSAFTTAGNRRLPSSAALAGGVCVRAADHVSFGRLEDPRDALPTRWKTRLRRMRLHGLGGIAWAREFEAWRSGSRLGDSECLHSGRRAIGQTAARLTRRVYSIEALGSSY